MESTNTFHWMHVSDLHRGQARTEQVWAVVRREIHNDVERQIRENGPIDLVVFSGDIAFKGDKDEFTSAIKELEKLWEVFARLGTHPKLFLVPGNHDLSRPSKTSPLLNLATVLRQRAHVREELISGQPSAYRNEIENAFANYTNFTQQLKVSNISLAVDVEGLFPGDTSARLTTNGLSIGLVGLNTAWTHLEDGDQEGNLDIAIQQLNSVVNSDLPKWAELNHVNLLVTHHPDFWLNKESQNDFNGEIFHPDYFDAHLFGHMHDNRPETNTLGAHSRRKLQAASLFGLEKVNGATDRRHGYYFAKLDANIGICRHWPRRFTQKQQSVWQVTTDGDLLQRDDRHFDTQWKAREIADHSSKKQ